MVALVILVIYLWLCHKVASAASYAGRSYGLWFIISVLLDPIAGYVILKITG